MSSQVSIFDLLLDVRREPDVVEAKCRLSDGNDSKSKEKAATVFVRQTKKEKRKGRHLPHD